MKRCTQRECILHGKREVPYQGNTHADILFVGESVGQQEEREGTLFYDRAPAGEEIRKVCRQVGIPWDALFVTNAARCRINKQEMSGKAITRTLSYCRPKLVAAINLVKPKVVVPLGDFALRQVLKKSGIKKSRGKWVWSKEFDCWIFPTYHPSYICRNMALEEVLVRDLKQVVEFRDNGFEMKKNTDVLDAIFTNDLEKSMGEIPGRIAVDTETQGMDWLSPNFLMVSYSVAISGDKAFQVRMYEKGTKRKHDFTIIQEDEEAYIKKTKNFDKKVKDLRHLLECDSKKYMMNGNFDLHTFDAFFKRADGTEIRVVNYVMDIQAAAHLIEENVFKMASLEELQAAFTNFDPNYKSDFVKNYGYSDIVGLPDPVLTDYACKDAMVTFIIGDVLVDKLKAKPKLLRYFVRLSMPVIRDTLYTLEKSGIKVDLDQLPVASEKVEKEMNALEKTAFSRLSKDFREKHKKNGKKDGLKLTRREAVVADALFGEDGFHLKPTKLSKTKKPSVDKEAREKLLESRISKKAETFLIEYGQWSDLNTLFTRYLRGFAKHVRSDGRIHSSYGTTTAVTGRTSSSNPNQQNNPKRSVGASIVRRLLVAEEGKVLLAYDMSQAELRWMAHESNDAAMIRVFRNGEDIHLNTAKSIVSGSWDALSDAEKEKARRNSKAINFGLLYGMRLWGFVKYAKKEYGLVLSNDEAEFWIDTFFSTYPAIKTYHRSVIDFCKRKGYVESSLGRRRRLPEINSGVAPLVDRAEKQAMNHPIQAPSSDAVLLSGSELIEKKKLNPAEIKMCLFIHDELVFEAVDDMKIIAKYDKIIRHELEHPPLKEYFGVDFKIPFKSDAKIGKNLAEMKPLEL